MAKRSGKLPLKKAPCTFDQETLAKIDAILKGNRGRLPQVYRAILEAFPGREPVYERFLKAYREGITPQDFLEALFSPVAIKEHRPPKAEKRHRAGQEVAPGNESSPTKKVPPSPSNSAPPAQASVSDAASPRASRAKKFSEPLPADWKQRIEDFIAGLPSRHSKEQKIMLDLLRKQEIEEAAKLIRTASQRVDPPWSEAAFICCLEDVISRLSISKNVKTRSGKKYYKEKAKFLEEFRDSEKFIHKEEAHENLKRGIEDLHDQEKRSTKTKPKNIGGREVYSYLVHYFQTHLGKTPRGVMGLLMAAAFDWRDPGDTRIRASEWASEGLEKPSAANTTKKAFAAIDNLTPEEREAKLEKMSPRLLRRYLQSGGVK